MEKLDHADIVVTHACNANCKFCVDKFVHCSDEVVSLFKVQNFINLLSKHVEPEKTFEVLLLGGEPTMIGASKLITIAGIIKSHGFSPIISTNGIKKDIIKDVIPHFDWVQITVQNQAQIDYWKPYADKVNVKLAGDQRLTMGRLNWFIRYTKDFIRRSVCMYFDKDWQHLCQDEKVHKLLDGLDWARNGSYKYAWKDGVRYKTFLPGETNKIMEPSVPKLYPNGAYNCDWQHEFPQQYLGEI